MRVKNGKNIGKNGKKYELNGKNIGKMEKNIN